MGCFTLANAMERNSALTELNLSDNDTGESGAAALAEAMKRNSARSVLNFFNNYISDSGCCCTG